MQSQYPVVEAVFIGTNAMPSSVPFFRSWILTLAVIFRKTPRNPLKLAALLYTAH